MLPFRTAFETKGMAWVTAVEILRRVPWAQVFSRFHSWTFELRSLWWTLVFRRFIVQIGTDWFNLVSASFVGLDESFDVLRV